MIDHLSRRKIEYSFLPLLTIITLFFWLEPKIERIYQGIKLKCSQNLSSDLHQVVQVIDGDTIVILYHGKKETIRLLQINTPEKGKYGYWQATEALKSMVVGQKVRLEFEIPGELNRGHYGRILAYIFVNGLNVNIEMVRLGWSRFWTKYGEGKYTEEFRQAELEARKTDRGL